MNTKIGQGNEYENIGEFTAKAVIQIIRNYVIINEMFEIKKVSP